MEARGAPGLERLELRIERLDITFRFTFAFHAREVRFERERRDGEGFERIFPETFSFDPRRHDPAELFLQLDDLLRKPRLVSPGARRRDAENLVVRLISQVPRYLERLLSRLDGGQSLAPPMRLRLQQDVALLSQVLLRFIETRDLGEGRPLLLGTFLLRKLAFRSLYALMAERVEPDYLARYVRGEVDPVDPSDDPSESGFFLTLEGGKPEVVNRILVRMAERAFYLWLEEVCLDESNEAFEREDSPFADRESEVVQAISSRGQERVHVGADLTAFLRRPSRDCRRILKELETWFLRRYDIPHSSALIYHAAALDRGLDDSRRTLSWHTPRIHALILGLMAAPFLGAAVAYERAPFVFDVLCSAEVLAVNAAAMWFLAYRFLWKRDLSFFHASVPRIGAGIIVGYLPVFLIDEVWDLAERSAFTLCSVAFMLSITTLLYVYVEVQRRLGDTAIAFARARGLFLLGALQAFGVGVVIISLVGRFMVVRNWSPGPVVEPLEALQGTLSPVIGQLPRIIGVEPIYAFPSALLMMTFLSFFIGVFLQLMWEELPITEPL